MAAKDKVVITLEKYGLGVKVIVETLKRGELVRNLEGETKELVFEDKRVEL